MVASLKSKVTFKR